MERLGGDECCSGGKIRYIKKKNFFMRDCNKTNRKHVYKGK